MHLTFKHDGTPSSSRVYCVETGEMIDNVKQIDWTQTPSLAGSMRVEFLLRDWSKLANTKITVPVNATESKSSETPNAGSIDSKAAGRFKGIKKEMCSFFHMDSLSDELAITVLDQLWVSHRNISNSVTRSALKEMLRGC